MRGGFLTPLILCATLGIALSLVTFRTAVLLALLAAALALTVFFSLPLSLGGVEFVFTATWLSVIATAALLHLAAGISSRWYFFAAVNAGAWIGAVTSISGQIGDFAVALPFLFAFLLGGPIARCGWGISLKVFSSWLVAVAILAIMLSLTPTPGYMPDHME